MTDDAKSAAPHPGGDGRGTHPIEIDASVRLRSPGPYDDPGSIRE